MKFFAQMGSVSRFSVAVLAGCSFLLVLADATFAATDVPPGFKRQKNGSIIVVDPLVAVAPPGYKINARGVLVKDRVDPAAATVQSMQKETPRSKVSPAPPVAKSEAIAVPGSVVAASDAAAPAAVPPAESVSIKDILAAQAVEQETRAAAAAEEEIPPGFHRMADGTLMANQRDTAVAPPGYHLMSDGTLMRNGGGDEASGSHSHGGMWMLDYKFEYTQMNDMLDTTTKVTAEEVILPTSSGGKYGFMMAPTDMSMQMHMFMLMYHGDKFMGMVMAHYMSMEMGMLASDGTKSTMKTSGIGDTIVSAAFPGPFHLNFDVGVSIPTGSIDERGPMQHSATFTDPDSKYPYSMQLGSGTYDLIQGIRYEDASDAFGWGAGYQYKGRFQKNDNDYKLGDEIRVNTWLRWSFMANYSVTGKLQWLSIGQIEGEDKELNAAMSPDMDAEATGGRRLDLGVAVRYETDSMTSVTLEFAKPLYQNLWGPQMKTDWIFGLGVGIML